MARKILLADDSVTAQNMGRKILTDAGYDVVTVNNGSAALKRVSEQRPDLIVLDVYMPGYSGLEVCQRLKDSGETARIPILLTVGKLEPFKPEEARRVNADAFIVKPFEASELLSALTRLEDRMVPQAEGPRFSTSVSGIERFGADSNSRHQETEVEPDSGWKNRIRFPSKKKKEEPEAEPDAEDLVTTPFRDFRRGPSRPPMTSPPVTPAAKQEPGLVPDIPRDITPEELDALSALAAKLDGPIPTAEDIAPLADRVASATPVAEAPKEFEVAAPPEARSETVPAPAPAETKPEAEVAAPGATQSEAEIPAAAPVAPVAQAAPMASAHRAPVVEASQASTPTVVDSTRTAPETAPVEETVSSSVAARIEVAPSLGEPEVPAPVDKNDEPLFAVAASAQPPAASAESEDANSEVPQAEAAASGANAVAEVEARAESQVDESPEKEAPRTEEAAGAVVAAREVAAQAEERTPSEEELAEALRLLTPSQAVPEAASQPPSETLVAAGAALAEEAARTATPAGRWVAESVELSAEEAATSLEGEMFRTLPAQSSTSGIPEPAAEAGAAHTPAEDDAVEAAVAAAEAAKETGPTSGTVSTPVEASPVVTASAGAAADPQEEVSQSTEPAEAPEEIAAVTFADAVQRDEAESASAEESEPERVSATPAEAVHSQVEEDQDPNSEAAAGGDESMGKETKGKSGKSNWHQIHSTPAPAAKNDVVEAAKQADVPVEETAKAMAAAAAGDGASAADPNAIASIVDSVLADLRPKIVEEIAKKLGKK